jgi:hypothetical protein
VPVTRDAGARPLAHERLTNLLGEALRDTLDPSLPGS